MKILQNLSISEPRYAFVVAFTLPAAGPIAVRRKVTVLASNEVRAKRICRSRYPRGILLDVQSRGPVSAVREAALALG